VFQHSKGLETCFIPYPPQIHILSPFPGFGAIDDGKDARFDCINMFEILKAVEFRVNGKFRGFIFILRLQLRKNMLFRFGIIRKKAEKDI